MVEFPNTMEAMPGFDGPAPTSDATDTSGAANPMPMGAPAAMPAPLQPVSLATVSRDATTNPWRWNSGTKTRSGSDSGEPENWMEGPTLVK